MMSNSDRIATANGAMLADTALLGNALAGAGEQLFDPFFWQQRGELRPTPGGRGGSFFVGGNDRPLVLRHFLRGGFIARVVADRYLWCGEARVRAFTEWHLLRDMRAEGLPVPKAVAAGYRRSGSTYTCDLLIERIERTDTLSARLASGMVQASLWQRIGTTLRRFHAAGIDHADLNAHNILCGLDGQVSVVDFDRGRRRSPGGWQQQNLERLRRSLEKVTRPMPPGRFGEAEWEQLLAGYAAGA